MPLVRKQKVTLTSANPFPLQFRKDESTGMYTASVEAHMHVLVEDVNPRAFAEVRLLDAYGVSSDGLRRETWTYHNPDDYDVGEYVFVPFGYNNSLQIAKIEKVGSEGEYKGPGPIKYIDGRAVSC